MPWNIRGNTNKGLINSLPSAAYMRQWTGSALVQMMVCRLFGTKQLSKPVLGHYILNIGNKLQWFFNQNTNFSLTEMHLKKIICQNGGHFGQGEINWQNLKLTSYRISYTHFNKMRGIMFFNLYKLFQFIVIKSNKSTGSIKWMLDGLTTQPGVYPLQRRHNERHTLVSQLVKRVWLSTQWKKFQMFY